MDAIADLIVSTNDAKVVRKVGQDAGQDTFPDIAPPDTLTLIDAGRFPPRVLATVEVAASIAGPPQAVAIAPNGRLAVVSAPTRYDRRERKLIFETFLQIVDLAGQPPRVVRIVDVGSHPQGLALKRDGSLLLAATMGGTVAVLTIEGTTLEVIEQVKVSQGRLAGVAFTPDGKAALVALRDEQGVAVLNVDSKIVTDSSERVSTGVAPYAIDVDAAGHWAVVGNVGLAGLSQSGNKGGSRLFGDVDSFTLIDVSRRPFRAVQHSTVPSIPEGVAISPDGRWIAVLAMDGSNLTADNPSRSERGRLQLFEVRGDQAERVADLPAGASGQGVVFSADNRFVLAQFFVDKQIAVFAVNGGAMQDTGMRIDVTGGPASIRAMPR